MDALMLSLMHNAKHDGFSGSTNLTQDRVQLLYLDLLRQSDGDTQRNLMIVCLVLSSKASLATDASK